jgi:hypothetical protein
VRAAHLHSIERPLFLEGANIIFMNTKLRSVSTLGLSIGRDTAHTYLSIDEDFFNAKHLNGEARLVAIDVWGAGGKKSAEAQNDLRQWEDRQVEKSRKVGFTRIRRALYGLFL